MNQAEVLALLARELGAREPPEDVETALPPPDRCRWPMCQTRRPLATVDAGASWWCLDHLEVNVAVLGPGPVGECVTCGRGSASWMVGPAGEFALHARCLRDWAMGRVEVPRMAGAYGRRGRTSTSAGVVGDVLSS